VSTHPLLRRLSFDIYPLTDPSGEATVNEHGHLTNEFGESLYHISIRPEYWNVLVGAGYQSKFNSFTDLSSNPQVAAILGTKDLRLIEVIYQNPGRHKYDLLRALYIADSKTGNAAQIGNTDEIRQVSSGEWFRDTLETAFKFVGTLYLSSVGGAALSSWIGAAVVPQSVAAAYPALTQAVGQVALQTAVNGGDVEKAVTATVASYAGSIAGGYAGGLTDSAFIGKLAGTATGALFKGESVEDAVRQAAPTLLLKTGIDAMEIAFDSQPSYSFDSGLSTASYDPWGFNADTVQPVSSPVLASDNFNFGGSVSDSFGYSMPTDETSGLSFNLTSTGYNGATAPVAAPVGETNFWDVARDALKLLPMFVNRNVPPPQPAQRYGTTNPAAYPIGQPVTMPDGRVVVRSPDGSVVTVNRNGRVTERSLTDTLASVPPWAWGLGAAALIFVLKRR